MDFKGVCMDCIDIQNIQLKIICGWFYNFKPELKTLTKTGMEVTTMQLMIQSINYT